MWQRIRARWAQKTVWQKILVGFLGVEAAGCIVEGAVTGSTKHLIAAPFWAALGGLALWVSPAERERIERMSPEDVRRELLKILREHEGKAPPLN